MLPSMKKPSEDLWTNTASNAGPRGNASCRHGGGAARRMGLVCSACAVSAQGWRRRRRPWRQYDVLKVSSLFGLPLTASSGQLGTATAPTATSHAKTAPPPAPFQAKCSDAHLSHLAIVH